MTWKESIITVQIIYTSVTLSHSDTDNRMRKEKGKKKKKKKAGDHGIKGTNGYKK